MANCPIRFKVTHVHLTDEGKRYFKQICSKRMAVSMLLVALMPSVKDGSNKHCKVVFVP